MLDADTITDALTTAAIVGAGMAPLLRRMKQQASELRPNGGGSLRDAVDRIECSVTGLESQLRGRLELDPGGSFLTDEEGQCLWVSQGWVDLTGIEADDARGDGWIAGIHPDDRRRVYEEWRLACLAPGVVFDLRYKTAPGVQVRGRAVKLTNRAKESLGHLGSLTPVEDD